MNSIANGSSKYLRQLREEEKNQLKDLQRALKDSPSPEKSAVLKVAIRDVKIEYAKSAKMSLLRFLAVSAIMHAS